MAEVSSKRPRGDSEFELESQIEEQTKRHKSYNDILSILDEEEDESTQDLSSLITSLQQEISSPPSSATTENSSAGAAAAEEEGDDKDRVIRHLLEASDDELGIPNRPAGELGFDEFGVDENRLDGSDELSLCDGLWELEDANANYYTLLQAELFM